MVRAEFAHMQNLEAAIMQRFRDANLLPGNYDYDIHLDVPEPEWPPRLTELERRQWKQLIAKRIDAVCVRPDVIWILEVTPRESTRALGAMLVYKDLYLRQFKPTKPVSLGLVVEMADPALAMVRAAQGIRLWVV